jgi:hypothetical protein
MGKWNNFFLQKMGVGVNNAPYSVCESVATWGVFCKKIPFKVFDKVKAPAKRSWYDEDGDDEYIPTGGLKLEAYTMKVEFGCKKIAVNNSFGSASVDDVRAKVGKFLEYLKTSGMMNMYSSHTRIGRQNVRLESVGESGTWVTEDDGTEYLVFEVTFKVNDPNTDIKLA